MRKVAILTGLLLAPPLTLAQERDPYAASTKERLIERAYERKQALEENAHRLGQAAACHVIDPNIAAAAVQSSVFNFITGQDNHVSGPVFTGDIIAPMRQIIFDEAKKTQDCSYWHNHPDEVIELRRAVSQALP